MEMVCRKWAGCGHSLEALFGRRADSAPDLNAPQICSLVIRTFVSKFCSRVEEFDRFIVFGSTT